MWSFKSTAVQEHDLFLRLFRFAHNSESEGFTRRFRLLFEPRRVEGRTQVYREGAKAEPLVPPVRLLLPPFAAFTNR